MNKKMYAFLLTCIILELVCIAAYYQNRKVRYRFHRIQDENERSSTNTRVVSYFEVYRNGKRQTCQAMLKRLGEREFVQALSDFFQRYESTQKGKFFLFQCTPFQTNYLNRPFTFFLISDSNWWMTRLPIGRNADITRFKEYTEQCTKGSVMVFSSEKEPSTKLICPCATHKGGDEFGFLGDFMHNASFAQKVDLFQAIQKELALHLLSEPGKRGVPMFISTHGLDVPWLHVRLETPLPKHYTELKKWYDLLP
jgi:hypothetical protein